MYAVGPSGGLDRDPQVDHLACSRPVTCDKPPRLRREMAKAEMLQSD